MYTDILQQFSLPKNEAKIYEALIGLGPANISVISSVAKVNRRNVYDSIKNLLNRKLVVRVTGAKENLYQAMEPKKLQDILNGQKEEIGSILPELKKLYRANIPTEQAFIARGPEGIKNFWNFVMSQNKPVFFIGGKGAWHDVRIDEERKKYFEICQKRDIKIQGLFDNEVLEKGSDIYSQYDSKLIRFLPKEYSTKATYDICGDRIVLFPMPKERSVENVTIFNIVSQSLADSFRTWFQFLWQKAKPLT